MPLAVDEDLEHRQPLRVAHRLQNAAGWVVLRASGFMHEFFRPHPLGEGIRLRGEIRTSARDGRVGWIDVQDVAAAAAALLSAPGLAADDDYQLTGPEALSHPEAAAIITAESGPRTPPRRITSSVLDLTGHPPRTFEEFAGTWANGSTPMPSAPLATEKPGRSQGSGRVTSSTGW